MTRAPGGLSEPERAALQRRLLRTLTVSQMVGSGAVTTAVTIGAFVVQDILGDATPWAGVASAATTAGGATLSLALSQLMGRRGRRPGLQVGYLTAAAGSLLAAAGAEHRALVPFLAGIALFGGGQASNLLARYVATDLALAHERGRAMSRVVFASAFGAVLGPLMAGPAQRAGEDWLGLGPYTGPWLVGAVLFLAGTVHLTLRMRPDPLAVTGALDPEAALTTPPLGQALRTVASHPAASLGLAAMAVSQGAMAAVMTMTPVHMKLHGHESTSLYVISLHIAGMYLLSPFVGRFADRAGNLAAVVAGAWFLVAATATAALSGDVEQLLFPALWALGLGWSFGLIGGSGLLVASVPAGSRVAVQGSADLLMVASGSAAGFASGFVRQAAGYHALSAGALAVTATLGTRALLARRDADRVPSAPAGASRPDHLATGD